MDKFFAQAVGGKKESSTAAQLSGSGEEQKPLPKGVVIGKDGKPYELPLQIQLLYTFGGYR